MDFAGAVTISTDWEITIFSLYAMIGDSIFDKGAQWFGSLRSDLGGEEKCEKEHLGSQSIGQHRRMHNTNRTLPIHPPLIFLC